MLRIKEAGARSSRADQAYEWIRGEAVSGRLTTGERLTEQGLASRLSMSRTPVREALQRLVLAGVLEGAPGVGYQLRRLRYREADELLELRLLLEPDAAALAARRSADGVISRDGLAEHTDRGFMFDAAMAGASGNSVLASLVTAVHERMALHEPLREGAESVQHHLGILEAVAAGDPDVARSRMVAHLEDVRAAALARIGARRTVTD